MLNEILGTAARYNQLLSRKFNISGGAPAPQLTPEIGCSLNLETGIEGHVLAAEMPYTAKGAAVGAAGQRASVGLFNPLGSNLILVVEYIAVAQTSAVTTGPDCGLVYGATPHPNLAPAGAVIAADTRIAASGSNSRLPAGQIRSNPNTPPLVATDNLFRSFAAVGQLQTYTQPFAVAPNTSVMVTANDLVASISCWFRWVEVPMAPGEVGPF